MDPDVALNEMEKTLNALVLLENEQKAELCTRFRQQAKEFEKAFQDSDPRIRRKVESLLWFCDQAAQDNSPLGRLNSSTLEWPHILLQSIRDKISQSNSH